jgi:muconolactone D-isomerase
MLFYVQMKWELRDKSLDELLRLELAEIRHAQSQQGPTEDPIKVVGIWKVASQHRVIVVVDAPSAEALDSNSMFRLPMRNYLEFEVVWPLSDYGQFARDLDDYFKRVDAKRAP